MIEFNKYILYIYLINTSPIMKDVFTKRILKYNRRSFRLTLLPNPKIKIYGTDRISYKAAKLWSRLPVTQKICHR